MLYTCTYLDPTPRLVTLPSGRGCYLTRGSAVMQASQEDRDFLAEQGWRFRFTEAPVHATDPSSDPPLEMVTKPQPAASIEEQACWLAIAEGSVGDLKEALREADRAGILTSQLLTRMRVAEEQDRGRLGAVKAISRYIDALVKGDQE